MNRSDFFKKLGLGALAVVVAPKMLVQSSPSLKVKKPEGRILVDNFIDTHRDSGKYIMLDVSKSDLRKVEDAGFAFLKEEYSPAEYRYGYTGYTHLLYYRGKYIYLRPNDTKSDLKYIKK